MTKNLQVTESLLKLVIQDMPLVESAQRNLVEFVEKNVKLETLHLINLGMKPEIMQDICVQLEQAQNFQSLSFRKNVPPKFHAREKKIRTAFCEALTELIKHAPALMHLDISEMYLETENIRMILCEGVAESRTMAGVHFEDNHVEHWDRIAIWHRLTRRPQSR